MSWNVLYTSFIATWHIRPDQMMPTRPETAMSRVLVFVAAERESFYSRVVITYTSLCPSLFFPSSTHLSIYPDVLDVPP